MRVGRVGVLVGLLAASLMAGCGAEDATEEESGGGEGVERVHSGPVGEPPETCLPSGDATRDELTGQAVWVRFCGGKDGVTAPAEMPADVLVSHLELLAELEPTHEPSDPDGDCGRSFGRRYRLQIGYGDGEVAEVFGATDPDCAGSLRAGGAVAGPDGLGVYGLVMHAFGLQVADRLDPAEAEEPLRCPDDPGKPDQVDLDGASAEAETVIKYGREEPMVMPAVATGGILCTWERPDDEPAVSELSEEDAERVRIGMHAIFEAMVDCQLSPEPTYTAVVEDKTGTRRAVTVFDGECGTVVRSDGGYGLGFDWLDR